MSLIWHFVEFCLHLDTKLPQLAESFGPWLYVIMFAVIFCETGLVVTRQVTDSLQVGLEIFHQTPDTQGGLATTSVGAGFRYDLNDHFHFLGYVGRATSSNS